MPAPVCIVLLTEAEFFAIVSLLRMVTGLESLGRVTGLAFLGNVSGLELLGGIAELETLDSTT